MPKETKMVTAKVRYARTVIMETTVEVPETDFEGISYVGKNLDDGRLPGVYATERPDHVVEVCDDEAIWEVDRERT